MEERSTAKSGIEFGSAALEVDTLPLECIETDAYDAQPSLKEGCGLELILDI